MDGRKKKLAENFSARTFVRKTIDRKIFGRKNFGRKIFAETKKVAEKAADRVCWCSRIIFKKKKTGMTVFRTPVSAKRVAGGGGSPPRSVRQKFFRTD